LDVPWGEYGYVADVVLPTTASLSL